MDKKYKGMVRLDKRFGNSIGTSRYYTGSMKRIMYTDGIKDMCDKLECHWILDIIESVIMKKSLMNKMLLYIDVIAKDNSAVLEIMNGSDVVYSQSIEYTDLPDGYIYMMGNYDTYQDKDIFILGLPIEG